MGNNLFEFYWTKGFEMKFSGVLNLPINLFHRGVGGEIISLIVIVIYILVVIIFLKIIYRMINYFGVSKISDSATIVAKRVVASHRELQGRYLTTVPEQYVVDIIIKGQRIVYKPSKLIFEEIKEGGVEPVEFVVGRLDGKIRVTRLKII